MSHAAPLASPFTGQKEIIIGEEVQRADGLCYMWDNDEGPCDTMRVYALTKKDENEAADDEEAEKGVLVGRLQLVRESVNDEEQVWLSDVQVCPSMQRRGIGSTLIKLAQEFDLSHVPAVESHDNYRYSLTGPGQRLVARCIESGILPPDLCFFSSAIAMHHPWSSALVKSDDDGDERCEDPHLDSAVILQAIANRKAGVVTASQAAPVVS